MFDIDLFDASLGLAMSIALFAGFLSFLSPCVLPIVPPYIAYMAGTTLDRPNNGSARHATLLTAVFFVLGLSTIFLLLGLAASAVGQVLFQYQRQLAIASGLMIVAFGLHFVGMLRIPFLNREARFNVENPAGSAVGAYVLGLAFAFGWTPCIGPVLGAVLAMAAQEISLARSMALMACYAVGLGLPFLLVAAFLGQSSGILNRLKRHMRRIEQAMGLLLVVVGLMMVTGVFSAFAFWLLDTFPALGFIG